MFKVRTPLVCITVSFLIILSSSFVFAQATDLTSPLYTWVAQPLHQLDAEPFALNPVGLSPAQIRMAYNLPPTGGEGQTIAIVNAYDAPTVQNDLTVFSNQYNLPVPTAENFEIHKMTQTNTTNSGWALETALDVQWAHAIAPQAKILLVEAKSALLVDLLAAVDYARSRSDVVAISMSWGSDEFQGQSFYNYHFTSSHGASFFAASGDDGAGLLWPASSANVISVGGTTLTLSADGSVSSETAWSGSGGGVSAYETRPAYQTNFGITTRRAVPDVSYNGNPNTGVSVYTTSQGWAKVGGTSAGSPQWAAIHTLGLSVTHNNVYEKAKSSSYSSYFRDITSGSNGYNAVVGYDYATGVGSPLTINFGQTSQIIAVNTSITLSPAGQSTALSATNQFAATYRSNGVEKLAYLQDGTSVLSVDTNTNVVISGTSTASTELEKWVFTFNANAATTPAGFNLSLSYYHLLAQPTSYAIIGGGNPQIPTVAYYTAPSTAGAQATPYSTILSLSQMPQTIWSLKGTAISVVNPLTLGSSERWTAASSAWTTTAANQLPSLIRYTHQFLLTATGTQSNSQWYNSGETAQVTTQGVFNRVSSSGQRVSSYTLDSGSPTQIQPTAGNVQINVLMDAPHRLTINAVNQYRLTLDTDATRHLAFITSPTIDGDLYWYDEGTSVKVTLNGIINRQSGTGDRLTSYIANTATTSLKTLTPVDVLNVALNSPQAVFATATKQYQLSTPSGSVKTVTDPTIPGDLGWYDGETNVTVTYNYSWNLTGSQSRFNAVSYTINQAAATVLNRSGNGTFIVKLNLAEPKIININSVEQHYFTVSGSPDIQLSSDSPTADMFFDAGSAITVSAAYIWGIEDDNSRRSLVSYTLDSETVSVIRAEEGSFSTSEINFSSPRTLTFTYITQFLASFQFKDNSGTYPLSSAIMQITTDNFSADVPDSGIWLDQGAQFQINSIVWGAVDVKPDGQASYIVTESFEEVTKCKVYNAKLEVKDFLNLPISGAQVTVTFANQSTLKTTTSADGTVTLNMIPLGKFNATISYLAESTYIAGDASSQPAVTAKIFASASVLSIVAGLTIASVSSVLFIRRRLNIAPKNVTSQPD